MADAAEIARAKVTITADLSQYDESMRELPNKVSRAILDLEQKIKAQMARVKLDLKVAGAAGSTQEVARLTSALGALEQKLNAVNAAAVNQANKLRDLRPPPPDPGRDPNKPRPNPAQGGKGFDATAGAMALMQLGSAIDDLQYGFRGILNNIPMMVSGFAQMSGASATLSMGLGAVAAILLTVVYQLATHWSELMEMMGMGKVKTEAEEMEALAAATHRTFEEEERLAKFREREKQKKELFAPGAAVTPEEKERRAAMAEAIKAADPSKIAGNIVLARRREGSAPKLDQDTINRTVAEEQNSRKNLFMRNWHGAQDAVFGVPRASRAASQRKQNEFEVGKAQDLVAKIAAGDKLAAQQLLAMSKRNPELFPSLQGAAGQALERAAKDGPFETKEEREHVSNMGPNRDTFRAMLEHDAHDMLKHFAVGGTRESLLNAPNADVSPAVEGRLKAAGFHPAAIKEMGPMIVKMLKDQLSAEIKDRAVQKGISEDAARRNLADEARDKKELARQEKNDAVNEANVRVRRADEAIDDFWKKKNTPQFMGFQEYFKKLSVGGFETEAEMKQLVRLNEDAARARAELKLAILRQRIQGYAIP